MSRFRIYCSRDERELLPDAVRILRRYSGFVIADMQAETADDVRRQFPVEQLAAPKRATRTARERAARVTAAGPPYLWTLQLNFPAKNAWLAKIRTLGLEIVSTARSNTVVVLGSRKSMRTDLLALDFVTDVEAFAPASRLTPGFWRWLKQPSSARRLKPMNRNVSRQRRQATTGQVSATFVNTRLRDRAARRLRRTKGNQFHKVGDRQLVVDLVRSTKPTELLDDVLARPGLQDVSEKRVAKACLDSIRSDVGGRAVRPVPQGIGLSGGGETIAITDSGIDTGDPNTLHQDFDGRLVRPPRSFPVSDAFGATLRNVGADDGPADASSGHGTHITGIVVGSGAVAAANNLSPVVGMCPDAKILFQAVEQTPRFRRFGTTGKPGFYGLPEDLSELFDEGFQAGARVHCNAWGSDKGNGQYTEQCRQIDQFVWNHDDYVVVFSAGNEGQPDSGNTRQIAAGSVTPPGTAKNCITVGAAENQRTQSGVFTRKYGVAYTRFGADPFKSDSMTDDARDLFAAGSRGPCQLGRTKPDVVAPGTFVLSTLSSELTNAGLKFDLLPNSQKAYGYASGTSPACAVVAGMAALIRQYLRTKLRMRRPSAALVKAAIVLGATYQPYQFARSESAPVADNEQGWGHVNLTDSVQPGNGRSAFFFDRQGPLTTGSLREFHFRIQSSTRPFRVCLVYSDPPPAVLTDGLRNNLQLQVWSPSDEYLLGNDFSGARIPDSTNNVEGIHVERPQRGNWRIRVVGAEVVPDLPQPFALAVSCAGTEIGN